MNVNDLKKLVKHCVYEEKGIVCMNDTYYNDIIHTMENLQFKIDNLQSKIESLEEDAEYWKEKYKELEDSLNNDYDPEIEIPQIHGVGISIERSEI